MTSQTLLEYNSIVEKNRDIADFIYDGVVNTPNTINLFQARDREKLYDGLLNHYKQMSLKYSIRQLHFHLPDSSSFLRMHKKELYGDSLVGVRESVEYVNKTLKPFYGFEEGRVYNGFRYVYPLFNEDEKHLGSVEISYDIKSFMDGFHNDDVFDFSRICRPAETQERLRFPESSNTPP